MTPAGPELALRVVADRERLQAEVRRLGGEISSAYPDGVLFVAVLKGSVLFLADLVRAVDRSVPVEIDFLAISSYAPDSGRVRLVKDLDRDIHGLDVVLVEDIVDTGLTLAYITGELDRRGPRSLAVCTLLDKAVRRLVPTPLRFVGLEIADEFVVGYGLDHAERYRNLDRILTADRGALTAGADAYEDELFGTAGGRVER
ncbi:MAG TPA: hypoxanthine phosphoribosyltransferase [Acidimicrobiales bacterium]